MYYENKTNKCKRTYVNLLHSERREPPTCFGLLFLTISRRCFTKDTLQRPADRTLPPYLDDDTTHIHSKWTLNTRANLAQIIYLYFIV